MLEQLVRAVHAGASRALVIHGEPGVGKTALLEYAAVQAAGYAATAAGDTRDRTCRLVRAGGVQSEMELPFAGLHQLCGPLLGHLGQLPGPQQVALRTAFGISAGPTPDRFLVGLAVLSLLSDAAERQPLVCLIDDHQWIDRASAQVLAFVARRLGTESVGLLVASRVVDDDLRGLPELAVGGLRPADAEALLDTVLTGPVDVRVRDQILAETHGNPLALLELPKGLTSAELAGGFGLPGTKPLSGSIEESFARRARGLPEPARLLLLIAASDPAGDSALTWRAAGRLGIDVDAAAAAVGTGLIELGARARFRHPLARSAVYRSASAQERRRVHGALAEVIDPEADPDRRAWHRAQAVPGPDEDVAAELDRSAARARARGGLAASAAFLTRAATLTPDPAVRADRALAAAETQIAAGAFDAALDLLAMAEARNLSDLQRAQADLIHGQLAFVTGRGSDAPLLLLKAARRLEPIDVGAARATYLDALSAAIFAGRLAKPGGDVPAAARAVSTAPRPEGDPLAADLLLDGTALMYNEEYAAGLPALREALTRFGVGMPAEEELRWSWFATTSAIRLWDEERLEALSARHLRLARDLGSLSELPLALTTRAYALLFRGEINAAALLTDEAQTVAEATGTALAPYGALGVAAFRGDGSTAHRLLDTTLADVERRGEGVGITFAEWSHAVLANGSCQHEEAFSAACKAAGYPADPAALIWTLVELVEAAVRVEEGAVAIETHRRFAAMAAASGTDWALGLQARTQALVSRRSEAEGCYQESIARLGRTRLRVDLARARLLYGEWLRREGRLAEAREQLRTAHRMFEAMGVHGFADRANRELRAAGGSARKRVDASRDDELTAQEAKIARLAREGLSNPEIANRLLISPHTVQYHLRKVFTKLGITSRTQL